MAGAPGKVKQLVDTFSLNIDFYKEGNYNETQLRRENPDPFFTELNASYLAAHFHRDKPARQVDSLNGLV